MIGDLKPGRILDLSYRAAKEIDMLREGIVEEEITIIKYGAHR